MVVHSLRARVVLLLCVLVALAAAFAAMAGAAWGAAAPTRIMPLGDSITHGYNIPGGYRIDLEDSLVAGGYAGDFVGSRANGPVGLADRDHEGHSGWRIDQLSGAVGPWLARTQPGVVLLLIGTNDMLTNDEVASAPQRLSALIDRIAAGAPSAHILVGTLPPSTRAGAEQRIAAYNAALPGVVSDKVAQGRKVALVEEIARLTPADLADGVHPNRTGYGKIAAAWYRTLTRVLPVAQPVGAGTPLGAQAPAPAPPLARPTVSIGGLSASSATGARRRTVTAEVRVRDQNDAGVAGATVSFALSGASSGARTCTTAATGSCAVKVSLGRRAAVQGFTVTGITAATGTYEPARNARGAIGTRPLARLTRLRPRRTGLGVDIRVAGSGRMIASARLPAGEARRLRLHGTLATTRRSISAAGSHELFLRFSRRTRARVARQGRVTLILRIRAVDSAGVRHSISRRVRLRL